MKKRTLNRALLPLVLAVACAGALAQSGAAIGGFDEQKLMGELAARNMETLLQRSFEVNKIPPEQRNGVIAVMALNRLSKDQRLTASQRKDLIQKACTGIEGALPSITDPETLMRQAVSLIGVGVEPGVNLLEYWGENPRTQAEVKPIVVTVQKLLDQSAATAATTADKLANEIKSVSQQAAMDKWQKMKDLETTARFTSQMMNYDLAIVLPAGDPKRTELADSTLKYLADFDNADSGVQAAVESRSARLLMAKGDYAGAAKLFNTLATDGVRFTPPADLSQQYEARYFSINCLIKQKQFDDADKAMSTLDAWEKTNLPETAQKDAAAAFSLLKYHLLSARSDAATAATDKKDLNDQAIAALLDLLKDQPGRKETILEMVLSRMPENADVKQLDPLLLLAMQHQGEQEVKAGDKPDAKVVERAIAAANELLTRKGAVGVDANTIRQAALVVPYMLEKLGKKQEAAEGYINYSQWYPTDQYAASTLASAGQLLGDLRKDDLTNQQLRELYDRLLALAIAGPFNHKELAYKYAYLQMQGNRLALAVEYFAKVPANDSNIVRAHYYLMVCQQRRLEDRTLPVPETERPAVLAQIQLLADQVPQQAAEAAQKATSDTDRQYYQTLGVRTALLAASIAKKEQKDPARALQLLEGIEGKLDAFSKEDREALLTSALFLRVSSLMEMGKTDEATKALVSLLNGQGSDSGVQLIFRMLPQLDNEIDQARKNKDDAQAAKLAGNRAMLSGFLVKWAENNADPKIKEKTNSYKLMDASNKIIAADLEKDGDKKKSLLAEALKNFQELYNPNSNTAEAMTTRYKIGVIQYGLGDYKAARDTLGYLVVNKKLGGPTRPETGPDGVTIEVDNVAYWEGTFKNLSALYELGKANPNDPAAQKDVESARKYLKYLYVTWPKTIGGSQFHDDFESLRKQMVPDFDPAKLDEAAASQPTK